MPPNRREFLKTAGIFGTGLALSPSLSLATGRGSAGQPDGEMDTAAPGGSQTPSRKILVFGGTGFIGPNTVRYAVERGHDVTIFTRGRSTIDVPGVERLVGDRNDNHDALLGRSWDVVIDNNASRDYRWVQRSTEILRDAVDHYIFVSSISAYRIDPELSRADRVLENPIVDASHPRLEKPDDWSEGEPLEYGPMKAYCEDIVHAAFPGRATVVRPGLIVGPGDPTDRFTYWPVRISEGGEVLAPGNPRHANQIIDQRDLTEWIVRLAEQGITGNFNGVGPASRLSMAEMLYGIRAAFPAPVGFTWVSTEFLTAQEVTPWQDLPSWIPGDPLMFVDNASAIASGLTYRPLAATAADTAAWDRSRPVAERSTRADAKFGLSRDREKSLLAEWRRLRRADPQT
jgi:2'-hydroxyisoflavone reductase